MTGLRRHGASAGRIRRHGGVRALALCLVLAALQPPPAAEAEEPAPGSPDSLGWWRASVVSGIPRIDDARQGRLRQDGERLSVRFRVC